MSGANGLATCSALWLGPRLGPVPRACLASFVEMGHPVHLYAYGPVEDAPEGVTVREAAELLPRDAIACHRATGSPSLGSNRFRYALLRAGRGPWIDCDVLCLRPLPDDPWLVGWQNARFVNGAVLRIPADAEVLDDLLSVFDDPAWAPPWERPLTRAWFRLRRRLDPDIGVGDLRWGSAGPCALTYYFRRHGLLGHVRPAADLYPVPPGDADLLLDPNPGGVAARVASTTLCLHLWNRLLSEQSAPPPPSSFVAAVAAGTWRRLLPLSPPPA